MAKKKTLRMTRQRRLILEELRKTKSHPPADEVYERVRRRLPHISLGTVYRNLEVLSELGEVRKLEHGGSQRRFDGDVKDHYHIRCVRCGRVDDAPVKPLAGLDKSVRGRSHYEILGHRLEFVGVCPDCKTQAGKESVPNSVRERRNGKWVSEERGPRRTF